jgi:hypothetical protein
MAERDVQHAIRLALGRMTDVVLWRNSTGVARPNDRVVRYGLCVGSSDLIGILAPSGRLLALEVKTPVGRLTLEQRQFLELVRRRGGFACVVRSVDDAVAAMDRARAGASS